MKHSALSETEKGIESDNSATEIVLSLDGYSLIEQCVHHIDTHGTMYLKEHLLLFMLEGSTRVVYGRQTFSVHRNEMILLKKGTSVYYEKSGNPENNNLYDCLMFSLKDELVKSFLTSTELHIRKQDNGLNPNSPVQAMNECLIAFAQSLKPYFKDIDKVAPSQLRHKMMEMLYDTAICSEDMFRQILELQQPIRADLRDIVEQHYATPVRIEDLAYLSGRSLSSFKRDFQQVYNMSPGTWIREKRLNKAKEMLETTNMMVSEICYSLGFENVSHFSRIFKEHHGLMPTSFRQVV
jgi:AraC-like DNA-binding protein